MPDLDAKDKEYLIKKQACFSQLTDKECEILVSLLKEKSFKAGETIVTEGDIVDCVYLIIGGIADVRHVFLNNGISEFQSIAHLGPEQAIGLNDFGFYSLSGVRTASVVALTDMTALQFSVAAFHGFALAYPHVNEVMRNFVKVNEKS